MPECAFCELLAGRNEVTGGGTVLADRPLVVDESEHFIAILDVSPLAPGHSLIVGKEHWVAMRDLPEDAWRDLLRIRDSLRARLYSAFALPIVQFEHGESTAPHATTCCIAHAHLHVIPTAVDLTNRLRGSGYSVRECSLIGLAGQPQDARYAYYAGSGNDGLVVEGAGIPPQYMRRELAAATGVPLWNWHDDVMLAPAPGRRAELVAIRDAIDRANPGQDEADAEVAEHYAGGRPPLPEEVTSWIRDQVAGARTVVDAGCGSGFLLRTLVAPGRTLIGIDRSPAMIAAASSLFTSRTMPIFCRSVGEYAAALGGPDDALLFVQSLHLLQPADVDRVIGRPRDGVVIVVWLRQQRNEAEAHATAPLFARFRVGRSGFATFYDSIETAMRLRGMRAEESFVTTFPVPMDATRMASYMFSLSHVQRSLRGAAERAAFLEAAVDAYRENGPEYTLRFEVCALALRHASGQGVLSDALGAPVPAHSQSRRGAT